MEQINPEAIIAGLDRVTAELPDYCLKEYGDYLHALFMNSIAIMIHNPMQERALIIRSVTKGNDHEFIDPVIDKFLNYAAELSSEIINRENREDFFQMIGFYSHCYLVGIPFGGCLEQGLEKRLNEHPVHGNPKTRNLFQDN